MINITNKVDCCGCNACGDICVHKAISYKTDIEGFWYPVVDTEKCVNCGLCEKVCPVINVDNLKKNDLEQSECYAAEHKNLEVVFDSTSGGIFSALAEKIYRDCGYVGGAIFNEDFSVRHYISANKNDLSALRSSKYLQSNLEGFFSEVKELLIRGEKVLVCGTPCQMAGLRAFLVKEYDNLIIADFICRGVNSPKVWRKYLDSFEERYGSPVVYAKAKSKEYGWRNLTQKVILKDGRRIFETRYDSNFTKGYLHTNAYCRPSCYDCRFKGFPRISDITLADFWGIEKVNKSLEKDLGTSLIMVNSQNGRNFFEQIKARINYIPVPFESIIDGNPALLKPLDAPKVDRTQFFEDMDAMSFTEIAEKYIKENTYVSLIQRVKNKFHYALYIKNITQLNPKAVVQFFKINTIKEIISGNVLVPTPYCTISIDKNATIVKRGVSIIGKKDRFKKSRLETRLLVCKGATLEVGPGTFWGYGSDIEVLENATLKMKGHGGSNIGLTIVCGSMIEIGDSVMIGRNVTIRDNNGNHFINRQGYKNARPVIIGDKVWLCEQCVIMNGVRIGEGAIVGAKSFVIRNVPANVMVSGHPAEVIDEDILWKY